MSEEKERDPFAVAIAKLNAEDVSAMMTHMMRQFAMSGLGQTPAAPAVPVEPRQHRLDLPPIDTKLAGPEQYLPWSRRVRYTLEAVSYTHLRAHETDSYLVCRLLLE